MVKRCGKSAPREAQATRHGKPHRVQGQIGNPGAARSRFRESETDSGYRLLRQMILSVPLCGMQTEFGLQPFQSHLQFTIDDFRFTRLRQIGTGTQIVNPESKILRPSSRASVYHHWLECLCQFKPDGLPFWRIGGGGDAF